MVELMNIENCKFGYVAILNGEKVFVVAKNISDAMDKLEIISNGLDFKLDSYSSLKIV